MKDTTELQRAVRNVGNIANLSTPLGLALAALSGARLHAVNGLIVADRARLPIVTASAITVGSVVVLPRARLDSVLERIPGLLSHEDRHAYQWAYCLGLPFIPAYLLAMGWSWLRTGDRASANFFEIQAGLELGGYTRRPRRPWDPGYWGRCSATQSLG